MKSGVGWGWEIRYRGVVRAIIGTNFDPIEMGLD